MSIFTNGAPRVATKEDCQVPWLGGKSGEYFRCAFCGKRFKEGDVWRFQFTNDIPKASGNPLVCAECDEGHERTRQKWAEKCAKVREMMAEEWWWFNRFRDRESCTDED